MVCEFATGNTRVEWTEWGQRARCVNRITQQIVQELTCRGGTKIDHASSPVPALLVTCMPVHSLLCLEAAGEVVIHWTAGGESAVCRDESGAVVGGPFACAGTFHVEHIVSPGPALDAICLSGQLAEEHPNSLDTPQGSAVLGRRLLRVVSASTASRA